MSAEFIDRDVVAAELNRWRVPAIEVVAVRDGEVLVADGFGHRDVEAGLPATPTTLFHHGSVSKPFTAALAADLVAGGTLQWDRPVRDYVPGFRMADPVAGERATVRDLLAHRSGIAQHDFAWLAHPTLTRPELVGRLRHFEGQDFRQGFLYSNLGYAAVGEVIAAVAGSTWEEELAARILKPAGMVHTVTSLDDALGHADHAVAYGERDGEIVPIPYRPTASIAPAGGVISCALDMGNWLLSSLAGGPDETRRVQTPMTGFPPPFATHVAVHGYGLGWVVGTYRGHEWLWHSGGVDGFWSHAALLPGIGAGVAVSANLTATRLPFALMLWLCDQLLGVEPAPWMDEEFARVVPTPPPPAVVAGARPSRRPAAFAGRYEHPGYGTLVVEADGDELSATLGVAVFEAAHRHFDTWGLRYPPFPEVPLDVTFHRDASGSVAEAWVPFEPAVAPVRFRRAEREG